MTRYPRRDKWAPLSLSMLLYLVAASPAHSTILTFDQGRSATNPAVVVPATAFGVVPQDYGDRVTAASMPVTGGQFTYGNGGEGFTPNVVAAYFQTREDPIPRGMTVIGLDHGDLRNVLIGDNSSETLNIRLTADSGYVVTLYHFDLAGFQCCDNTIAAVRVFNGTTEVFAQTNVLVRGTSTVREHTAFDFASPIRGSELTVTIDYRNQPADLQDGFAIDNVRFGQAVTAVPEPATGLLLAAGLAVLALGVRRRG